MFLGMNNYLLLFLILAPSTAFAQAGISGLLQSFGDLINPTIGVLVAIGLLVFFWGLAKFIFRVGGDEKAVEAGKKLMIWGLIALFVMVSVWGIVAFLEDAFLPGPSPTPGATPPGSGGALPPGGPGPQPPWSPIP